MKTRTLIASIVATGGLVTTACGQADAPGERINLGVAPLTLPGIKDACYTIEVQNDVGQTVWLKEHLCATQYGDSIGDITYVGTCDATNNDLVAGARNTVTLTLENLYDVPVTHSNYALGAVPDEEWDNPCGKRSDGSSITPNGDGEGPCQLVFECLENEDVPVVFNLAVMRDAEQGFFDIAVNFEDVFCSAKLDCVDEFLHNAEGDRDVTVNMTFACTAGTAATGPQATNMYLSNVELVCVDADPNDGEVLDTISQTINLASAEPGQQGATPPLLFQWANYSGEEAFTNFEKCYWNHAFGLDMAVIGARRCTLSATGTATDFALPGGAIRNTDFYPVITWSADVVEADGSLCTNNALNDTANGSGVTTSYVTPTSTPRPAPFTARYQCAMPPAAPPTYACVGATDARFEGTYTEAGASAVKVTVGGVDSVAYALPANAKLVESCCLAECCTP